MIQKKTARDQLWQEEHRRSFGPEVTKRPRPSMLPRPMTPVKQIVAKVTGVSPNYMKGTSSSEARRQKQNVQASSDKKRQTGKKLDISYSGDKKQSSSSGRLSTAGLKMGPSFKRSNRIDHCWDVNSHRTTCSSFLKDSKLTESMLLTPLGVLKLCPYKYCSLNAHIHIQFPPLKSFISADDGCVDNYVDEKRDNGNTREIDIQVIGFEAETMHMELGEAEDSESASAEMMSLLEVEGTKLYDYVDVNIGMMVVDVEILDEKQTTKKAKDWEEVDGEEVEDRIEFVLKTEDTLFTLAGKSCKREECIEDWREFNPRELNYLQITTEQRSETVELKHQNMDERKNAEEWMTDYALQQTVSKLALGRKWKVALLVEAFETIKPTERTIAYGRHLQTCN